MWKKLSIRLINTLSVSSNKFQKKVQHEQNHQNINNSAVAIEAKTNINGKKERLILVSCKGKKGNYVIKSMKKKMKCLFPTRIVTKIASVYNKSSTCFLVKDVIEFKNNHYKIYQGRCYNDQSSIKQGYLVYFILGTR